MAKKTKKRQTRALARTTQPTYATLFSTTAKKHMKHATGEMQKLMARKARETRKELSTTFIIKTDELLEEVGRTLRQKITETTEEFQDKLAEEFIGARKDVKKKLKL